jgi:hypothetical protein
MRCMKIIAIMIFCCVASAAQDEFYRIVVIEPSEHGPSYVYFGSVNMNYEELKIKIGKMEGIEVRNLRAWVKDKWISWVEYDKNSDGTILINAKSITSVMRLVADPLKIDPNTEVKKPLF